MPSTSDFSALLAAARASRAATQSIPVVPALATTQAPADRTQAAPARSTAASWDSIADGLNAKAGLHRGANIVPPGSIQGRADARTVPPKNGAASWSDIAATVNAEAGVSRTPTTGAPR